MPEALRFVPPESVISGWDFSTGGVKCLAFDLDGNTLAEVRLPTDLWKGDPYDDAVCELNLMQLEGQARASVRALANRLRELKRLEHWLAGGISATHHTAGRIDADCNPVRRAICWNDHTLARYHKIGLQRLGGQKKVEEYIGGPWAIRYSLSHLVKDEDPQYFDPAGWQRTYRILPHGPLAAGYLTGNFEVISVSSAASTGLMDLRTSAWQPEMLLALADRRHRQLVKAQLPRIVAADEPIGPLAADLGREIGMRKPPLLFPTSDDQAAGLVGGGAVDDRQMAIVLGNSAVVNSSSAERPKRGNLDVMKLNWGPYLWMRCYNNGAQFLDRILPEKPNWRELERLGRHAGPGAGGSMVLPFAQPEPSLGVSQEHVKWFRKPANQGESYRAALEALAFLIALGVREHEQAGQTIEQITVSGGIARSDLMCEILASVLNRRLERLKSDEGPALGAAVTALAACESHHRRQRKVRDPFTVADAVRLMVGFRKPVQPNRHWVPIYEKLLARFEQRLPQAS
jgi:sugar (pentulose or hexulose) kinase